MSSGVFQNGKNLYRYAVWAGLCLCLCSCASESLDFMEVKRVHERITPAEWATFQRIVEHLPEQRIPAFSQPIFPPPPEWVPTRSLPIRDLYEEEKKKREKSWDASSLAPFFDRHKTLVRELRVEKMTKEQFAGLLITISAAACLDEVPEGVDLDAFSDKARFHLGELDHNLTPFMTLPPETQHVMLQHAMWISRKIRADVLRQVPSENLSLVRTHREWIRRVLPEEFCTNPVYELHDRLEEQGLPFEELPESGYDEDLRWPQAANPAGRY